MNTYPSQNGGFTLIETIMAMTIGIIAVTIVSTSIAHGFRSIAETKRLERLHANATLTVDSLTYIIKQATEINVMHSQAIEITTPTSKEVLALDTGRLILNGQPITNLHQVVVTDLAFEHIENSVHVKMTLRSPDNINQLKVSTTIAHRN